MAAGQDGASRGDPAARDGHARAQGVHQLWRGCRRGRDPVRRGERKGNRGWRCRLRSGRTAAGEGARDHLVAGWTATTGHRHLPVMLSHGYSGWWRIDNRFDLWRGLPVEHPDSIYFHGSAALSIPPDGQGGTGIMYGATYISVHGYNARLDVVNEIRDATVSQDGGLRLRIEV